MTKKITLQIPESIYKELRIDADLNELTIENYIRWLIENRDIEHCFCDVCGSVIPELDGEFSAAGSDRIYIVHVIKKMLLKKGHTKQKSLAQARKLQRDVKENLNITHYFDVCSKECARIKTKEIKNLYLERQILWLKRVKRKQQEKNEAAYPKNRGRKKKATAQVRILLPKIRKAMKTDDLDALKSLKKELEQVAILQN